MPQVPTWMKIGALFTFSFAALGCAVLGIYILAEDKTTKAGIATLTFNFNLTDIHLPEALVEPRITLASGLLQPFQSEVAGATSLIHTAISDAAGAAATAISDITTIEATIPRNFSLGTKQYCIGFENKINCTNFPFNFSNVLPESIETLFGDEVQSLEPLEGILAKVTPANIQGSLILALIFIFAIILTFACLFFKLISFAAWFLKLGVCLVAISCFVLCLIPYLILHEVQSKIQGLQSVVGVEDGDVGNLTMAALVCAGVMMLWTMAMSIFM